MVQVLLRPTRADDGQLLCVEWFSNSVALRLIISDALTRLYQDISTRSVLPLFSSIMIGCFKLALVPHKGPNLSTQWAIGQFS